MIIESITKRKWTAVEVQAQLDSILTAPRKDRLKLATRLGLSSEDTEANYGSYAKLCDFIQTVILFKAIFRCAQWGTTSTVQTFLKTDGYPTRDAALEYLSGQVQAGIIKDRHIPLIMMLWDAIWTHGKGRWKLGARRYYFFANKLRSIPKSTKAIQAAIDGNQLSLPLLNIELEAEAPNEVTAAAPEAPAAVQPTAPAATPLTTEQIKKKYGGRYTYYHEKMARYSSLKSALKAVCDSDDLTIEGRQDLMAYASLLLTTSTVAAPRATPLADARTLMPKLREFIGTSSTFLAELVKARDTDPAALQHMDSTLNGASVAIGVFAAGADAREWFGSLDNISKAWLLHLYLRENM